MIDADKLVAHARKFEEELPSDRILGHRTLQPEVILLINAIKQTGNSLGAVIEDLRGKEMIDQRWLAIAQTDLQKGIMSLVRAIARPDGF